MKLRTPSNAGSFLTVSFSRSTVLHAGSSFYLIVWIVEFHIHFPAF